MGVNTSLLPIKGHFFLYWGFISAVIPYMMVVARQLGVPVGVQGVVWAVITTLSLVIKPLLATVADAHPTRRKMVFMVLLGIMVCATTPIGFLQPLYHHQSSASSSSSLSEGRGLMGSDDDPIPSSHTLNHQPHSSSSINDHQSSYHQPQSSPTIDHHQPSYHQPSSSPTGYHQPPSSRIVIRGEMVISPTMGNFTTAYLLVQPNKERCEVVTSSWQCRASCHPRRQLCHQNNNKDDGGGSLRLSLLHGTHPARPSIITPQQPQHPHQNKLETTTEAAATPLDDRVHDVAEGAAEGLLVYLIEGWQHYQETPDILNITVSCESGERGWGEEECGGGDQGGRRDSGEGGGGRDRGGGGSGGTSSGDVVVGGKRNVNMSVRGGRIGDTGEKEEGGHKTIDKHTKETRNIKNHNYNHNNNEEVTGGGEGVQKSDRNVARNINHNNNHNHNHNYNNNEEAEVDIKEQQENLRAAEEGDAEEVGREEERRNITTTTNTNTTTTTTNSTKDDPQLLLLQPSVWTLPGFWLYLLLLLLGQITATTVESVSDAICCDIIGDGGDYGGQRVWGLVSYGLLGLLSGCLVDFYSMDLTTPPNVKDYTPAFLLSAGCGVLDILLAGARLKVPQADNNNKTKEDDEDEDDETEEGTEGGRGKRRQKSTKVWNKIKPLLADHRVIVFLILAFLIGFFDGLDTTYVFV
ncbi:hypothetical protein Pcinc_011629 [Petrolisthes cinctipes]|uniref:Major facilitator superfamily associated domain-containing protein n=1 Tax=Petrolisthes cinctipes TaxID=88211 RepID=A0AAE1G2B5_PETCI|nr:hypothetical protein Pcinc_011629 [Petrolisthes cinctipes]